MDYITIIKTEKPCNKQVGVNSDGSLDKTPASVIYDGLARTKYVPDQDAMLALHQQASRLDKYFEYPSGHSCFDKRINIPFDSTIKPHLTLDSSLGQV